MKAPEDYASDIQNNLRGGRSLDLEYRDFVETVKLIQTDAMSAGRDLAVQDHKEYAARLNREIAMLRVQIGKIWQAADDAKTMAIPF